jgi:hypothetical protein
MCCAGSHGECGWETSEYGQGHEILHMAHTDPASPEACECLGHRPEVVGDRLGGLCREGALFSFEGVDDGVRGTGAVEGEAKAAASKTTVSAPSPQEHDRSQG